MEKNKLFFDFSVNFFFWRAGSPRQVTEGQGLKGCPHHRFKLVFDPFKDAAKAKIFESFWESFFHCFSVTF